MSDLDRGEASAGAGSCALVLGCGGIAAIAWQTGLLAGLVEHGIDVVGGADLVVGTSAGATVGAQITSDTSIHRLLAVQLTEAAEPELPVPVDLTTWFATWQQAMADAPDGVSARKASGRLALTTDTVLEGARRAVIARRLPSVEWPERWLLVTAADAETGDFVAFDRTTGISLVDAVAASCAIPGVWPPVSFDGRRYIDGGVRSGTNADLAEGYRHVLVLEGLLLPEHHPVPALGAETDLVWIQPDDDARRAIRRNPLDDSVRPACARAGRAQAAAVAPTLRAYWPAVEPAVEKTS